MAEKTQLEKIKTFPSFHISVSILCPPDRAYTFASDPANLPKWASGLSGTIQHVNGEWFAESPMGKIRISFAPVNDFGVLDHDVTLDSGKTFYNPMRVVANGDGCEVIFTLYRLPGVSDEAFSQDAATIKKDLEKLKSLLEHKTTRKGV